MLSLRSIDVPIAAESNCLDCLMYAVSLKSLSSILCKDDPEISSWLAVGAVLRGVRFTRFITACTIGLVLMKRFRPGIALLEVVAVFVVYHFHAVLRHTSNCFATSLLLIHQQSYAHVSIAYMASKATRDVIITLKTAGASNSDITKLFDVYRKTAWKWYTTKTATTSSKQISLKTL